MLEEQRCIIRFNKDYEINEFITRTVVYSTYPQCTACTWQDSFDVQMSRVSGARTNEKASRGWHRSTCVGLCTPLSNNRSTKWLLSLSLSLSLSLCVFLFLILWVCLKYVQWLVLSNKNYDCDDDDIFLLVCLVSLVPVQGITHMKWTKRS